MRFHPNPDAPLTLGSAALASAGLLALAMPGRIGWWPLLFVALVPLLLIALYARPGRSALAGFCVLAWCTIWRCSIGF
jgi:hypothetical protein